MKYKVIMNNGNEHYINSDEDWNKHDLVEALCSTKYIEIEELIKKEYDYKWRNRKILLSTRNISEIVVPENADKGE